MDYKKILDVSNWALESTNDGSHGEGMLEKLILVSPDKKKYLYKKWWSRVKNGYESECKAQLSCEYINFRLAKELLDIDVPKTFLAINNNSQTFQYGVLSKRDLTTVLDYLNSRLSSSNLVLTKLQYFIDKLDDSEGVYNLITQIKCLSIFVNL